MTTTYIYALVDPRDKQVRYVGKTDHPRIRFAQHIADRFGSLEKIEWLRELDSLSLQPEMIVLEEIPFGDWRESERGWVRKMMDGGCNLVNGTLRGKKRKHIKREPQGGQILNVRLTEDEWDALDELQAFLGFSNRSQVIKRLIKTAYVKPASVRFIQPEEEKVPV